MGQEKGEKLYYSIGEVAEHLGVNPSLIRYWEKEFPMLNPRKTPKGERSFTQKEIRTLERIHHLVKREGYTLKGAKKRMREKGEEEDPNGEAVQRLKRIRQELKEWRDTLSSGQERGQ